MLYVSENPGRASSARLERPTSGDFLFMRATRGQARCDRGDLRPCSTCRKTLVAPRALAFRAARVAIFFSYARRRVKRGAIGGTSTMLYVSENPVRAVAPRAPHQSRFSFRARGEGPSAVRSGGPRPCSTCRKTLVAPLRDECSAHSSSRRARASRWHDILCLRATMGKARCDSGGHRPCAPEHPGRALAQQAPAARAHLGTLAGYVLTLPTPVAQCRRR